MFNVKGIWLLVGEDDECKIIGKERRVDGYVRPRQVLYGQKEMSLTRGFAYCLLPLWIWNPNFHPFPFLAFNHLSYHQTQQLSFIFKISLLYWSKEHILKQT